MKAGANPSLLPQFGHARRVSRSSEDRLPFSLEEEPVSELHLHIEGTLDKDTVFELARRNGMTVPADFFNQDNSKSYIRHDFGDFLSEYDNLSKFIRTADDVTLMVYNYLKRCHQAGAIYVEIGCS